MPAASHGTLELAQRFADEQRREWVHPRTLTDPPAPATITKPRRREGTVSNLIRRSVGNLPIRVPAQDWSKVVVGEKRQFRTYCERAANRERPVVPPDTVAPRPVLLYAVRHNGPARSRRWEAVPGVLLSHRQEPLASISAEDLALEGYENLRAFRWAWKGRYRKLGWRPLDLVSVLEVRPLEWNGADFETFGDWAMTELYGEWS